MTNRTLVLAISNEELSQIKEILTDALNKIEHISINSENREVLQIVNIDCFGY